MAVVVDDIMGVGARVDKENLGGMGKHHFPLAEDMKMTIFILLAGRKKEPICHMKDLGSYDLYMTIKTKRRLNPFYQIKQVSFPNSSI
jgi:hypothetical protein